MVMPRQWFTRFEDRLFGKFRGVVADVNDPKQYGRVRCMVPSLAGETVLGWAWPMEGGGKHTGDFDLPEVGDLVWVEFEEGDRERPLWVKGPWGGQGADHRVPEHARELTDAEESLWRGVGPIPESLGPGDYASTRVRRDPAGNRIEMDSTEGKERLTIMHASASMMEMLPDGTMAFVATGDHRALTVGSYETMVWGSHTTRAATRTAEIGGDDTEVIGGDQTVEVIGDQSYVVQKHRLQSATDVEVEAGGGIIFTATGNRQEQVLGSSSTIVGKLDFRQMMETAEWYVANAGASPTDVAWLLHTMNGRMLLKSTSPAGVGSKLDLGLLTAELDSLLVKVGSAASSPAVLGDFLVTALSTIMAMLDTHTHLAFGVPTTPPTTPIFSATFSGMTASFLSKKVLVE